MAVATGFLALGTWNANAAERIRVTQCIGSKQSVLSCCASARKPSWWIETGASCLRELSCYSVKSSSGGKAEECRIRQKDSTSRR
jgi:hypothetical protein